MTNQDDSYLSTPVLIIGYSRISAIREQILQLRRFGISRIYLALDFANDPSLQQEQEGLVNELLAMKVNPSTLIRVWYRTRNHGVAVGVLSALDWFFSENQYGVIVEDDLVYNLDFLKFCTWALKQYINSDEVLMISGNRYNSERNDAKLTGTNYPQIWGWASSDVKWAEIRRLILRSEKSFCNLTKNSNINYFYSGAKRARLGLVDTWDLPLAYEMLIRVKICILPPVNLVSNMGIDQYATHTKKNSFPLGFGIQDLDTLSFPPLDLIKKDCKNQNAFLEKQVFNVRKKHIFSPLKMWLILIYKKMRRMKSNSLELRLKEAESPCE